MIRKRRAFSDEFKLQAVRRVREREAAGVSLAQVGRELGVLILTNDAIIVVEGKRTETGPTVGTTWMTGRQ